MSSTFHTIMLVAQPRNKKYEKQNRKLVPVVLTCGEEFGFVGFWMRDDTYETVYMAAIRALQRPAVNMEQMHGGAANSENIIRRCTEHGGEQGPSANRLGLNYFFLAAAPNVQAACVVD